jgi:hypothetical protein
MALVFTALADSGCALLLTAERNRPALSHVPTWQLLDWKQCLTMAVISIGLYGFGMSLNDIIDRRRDMQLAAHRPLPSGRIGLRAAHVVCASLVAMAIVAGAVYSRNAHWPIFPYFSMVLVFFTISLIVFYDFAGKYLVALGLLTLGLIRFFHATIAAPGLPLLWHPLTLMNHVTIVSMLAYQWEQKRPPLTRIHWWSVLGGLGGLDAMVIGLVWLRRPHDFVSVLWIRPELLLVVAAILAFVAVGAWIGHSAGNPRKAGQTLMLAGLLWLIVYDAAFVAGYAGWIEAAAILLLLPIAYLSVQIMRWWNNLISLSQRPQFKRVET